MMELVKDKVDCCGCASCVQVCPKKCLSMKEDEEGFLYPIKNEQSCIDCGLCEKVCPLKNQQDKLQCKAYCLCSIVWRGKMGVFRSRDRRMQDIHQTDGCCVL